jgi:hypothetical protein
MSYVHPDRAFVGDPFEEADILPKIQIENSLELGWKPEDILLVTNFDYEHEGVKALVVGDEVYNNVKRTATKIKVIIELYKRDLVNGLFWFHDLDAFQLEEISDEEVMALLKNHDLALTDYGITNFRPSMRLGRNKRWSTGTLFFNEGSKYVFDIWQKAIDDYGENEEIMLLEVLKKKRYQPLKNRINRLNITYNFASRKRNVPETYSIADKPIKVVHFHPFDKRPVYEDNDNINVFVHGKNGVGKPLITDRLTRLFKKYGVA